MSSLTLDRAHAWLIGFADLVHEQAGYLTELDAAIGDADHGSNLDRGMAAVRALDQHEFDSAAAYVKKAGMTLVSTVGGASGPLYGTLLLRFAGALGDGSVADVGAALTAGVSGVIDRGRADAGQKTMVDALVPAVAAFGATVADGGDLTSAVRAAAAAAETGRDATEPMIARKGRASYLGERSAGHLDPGAASAALLLQALSRAVE